MTFLTNCIKVNLMHDSKAKLVAVYGPHSKMTLPPLCQWSHSATAPSSAPLFAASSSQSPQPVIPTHQTHVPQASLALLGDLSQRHVGAG
jgi:hypothetical protein